MPQKVCKIEIANNWENECKIYYGFSESTSKEQYQNHKSFFENKLCMKDIGLSKHV